MKRLLSALLVALGGLASPAVAQALPGVGTPVNDMMGQSVGTVIAAERSTITVKTDRHEIRIPSSSAAQSNGAILIAMTRGELNAAADQALASAARPATAPASGAGTATAEAPSQ